MRCETVSTQDGFGLSIAVEVSRDHVGDAAVSFFA